MYSVHCTVYSKRVLGKAQYGSGIQYDQNTDFGVGYCHSSPLWSTSTFKQNFSEFVDYSRNPKSILTFKSLPANIIQQTEYKHSHGFFKSWVWKEPRICPMDLHEITCNALTKLQSPDAGPYNLKLEISFLMCKIFGFCYSIQ